MAVKDRLRAEYQTRINNVMDYIGHHLDQELTLDVLARVACFSAFHFHRVFAALVGETLGDYIRRVRLERAAGSLSGNPAVPVTEIALDCGFASPAAFARAFRERFGMSASKWRDGGCRTWRNPGKAQGKTSKAHSKARKANASLSAYNGGVNKTATQKRRHAMDVQIKQLPGYHVAYLRYIGPYGPGVSQHWAKFRRWAKARDLVKKETATLGISHDDPSITPPEKCRYDACVTVPADFKPEAGVNLADIPGGKYAVLRFAGSGREIGPAWTSIYRDWLPDSGYQPDDRPCFELYEERHQCQSGGGFACDICIPVRPL